MRDGEVVRVGVVGNILVNYDEKSSRVGLI
jgi:hypothetical protein